RTLDLKDWVGRKIDDVCLHILDMIKTVLHADEVIEGTHRPEIILTDTPPGMIHRDLRHRIWIGFLDCDLTAIDDYYEMILQKFILLSIIDITSKGQELDIV